MARRQVAPLSVDTSTPPTRPPVSVAVPLIVTGLPTGSVAPAAGELIAVVGAVVSVEAVAAVRPVTQRVRLDAHVGEQVDRRLLGRRVGRGGPTVVVGVQRPRPLDRPALKTSAPLGAR